MKKFSIILLVLAVLGLMIGAFGYINQDKLIDRYIQGQIENITFHYDLLEQDNTIRLVTIGTSSPLPSDKVQSSNAVFVNGQFLLFDAGMGSVGKMEDLRLPMDKLSAVFITHWHSDHYIDLPGLVNRSWVLGRKQELHLYGPPPVDTIGQNINSFLSIDGLSQETHNGSALFDSKWNKILPHSISTKTDGDLKTELNFAEPRPAGGIIFRYNLDERLSLKSSVNYARIHAEDSDSDNSYELNRNLSFYSDIFEFTGQFEFNFFPYIHGSEEENWTPYLFAGVTGLNFSPKTQLEPDGQEFDLRSYGTEGQAIGSEYGRWTLATAYGLGIKWDINYDWSFNVELGLRTAASDYLDDVSTVYPDLDELRRLRGETSVMLSDRSINSTTADLQSGRQRGNQKNNDTYVLFGIGIVRYFGQIPCPKIGIKKKRKRKSTKKSMF